MLVAHAATMIFGVELVNKLNVTNVVSCLVITINI